LGMQLLTRSSGLLGPRRAGHGRRRRTGAGDNGRAFRGAGDK